MKRLLFILLSFVALTLAIQAAPNNKAQITFKTTTHDFGTIKASDGPVSAEYQFTNTGSAPLVIVNVTNGGCGCTKPTYPKEPVMPGKSAVITIHFDPTGRRGEFNRQVKVKTNAKKKEDSLKFNGVIVP